jgi:hypothetical protein
MITTRTTQIALDRGGLGGATIGAGGISTGGSGTVIVPPQTGHRPCLPALLSGTLSIVSHRGHLSSIIIGVHISQDANNSIMDPPVVQEHSVWIRRFSRGGAARRLL